MRATTPIRSTLSVAVSLVLLAPFSVRAGGFAISEMGARYAGRGNAVVAVDDSPASVFFNPANLTALSGLHIEAGVSLVFPRFEYLSTAEGAEPVKTEPGLVTPPVFSASYTFEEIPLVEKLALGLGFYVPYGSSFSWPDDWVGRQALQELAMTGFEISPVVAIRPHEKFAIGGGLRVMPVSLFMRRGVRFGDQAEGTVELVGSGTAIGGNAGITFWPNETVALSVAWRSPATLEAEGESNFDFPAPFDTQAIDRPLTGRLPLPEVYRAGVAWDLVPSRVNISFDFELQRWSRYEELAIIFTNPDGSEEILADPKNSQDSIALHVGVEWWVLEDLALRAGYGWDQRTLPEKTVGPAPPDSDRHGLAIGASYFFGPFGAHVHFADVFFVERETLANELRGTWRGGYPGGTTGYLVGVGVSAVFGAAEAPPPTSDPPPEIVPAPVMPEAKPVEEVTELSPETAPVPAPSSDKTGSVDVLDKHLPSDQHSDTEEPATEPRPAQE
ncbi:OmpP1/FadL family transporter [Myxococcota bacterium]